MDLVPACLAASAAGAAAVFDLRARRIPNWLTASAFAVGIVVNVWLGGLDGALLALTGAGLGLVMLLPFYALRAVGAGDVKLLAALGALVGPRVLISVAVYGGIAGGLLALAAMLRHRRLMSTVHQVLVLRTVPAPSGLKTPYGVVIATGMILTLVLPGVSG